MPPKKSDVKKTQIYACAKALFSEKGFKEANMPDIARAAGLATGTVYLYYPSKESLFMDIYIDENVDLKKKIYSEVDMNGDPAVVVQEIFRKNIAGMNENPILREWFNKDVFSKIEKKFKEDEGLEKLDFLYEGYFDMVKRWQEEGKIRSDIEHDMVMALFTAVILIDTHKEEIGVEYFPQLQGYLMDFLMEGLKPPSVSSNDKTASGGTHAG